MQEDKKITWYQRTRTRLTAAVTLAIMLPMLAFYLASVQIATNAQLKAAQENLRLIAESGSVSLEGFIREITIDLEPTPYTPKLTTLSARELELYLSFLFRLVPEVETLSLVTVDGSEKVRFSRIAVYSAEQLRDLSGSDALATIRKGRTFYGQPHISEEGEARMNVAIPIPGKGRDIDAMILAEVSLRRVFEEVSQTPGEFMHVYVVDENGMIIAHPDFSHVLGRTSVRDYKVVSDVLALPPGRNTQMTRYTNILGEEVLGLGRRSRRLCWGIIAEVDTSEALAGVRRVQAIFRIIFVSAAFVGFVASLYIGTRAGGLIGRIQRAAQAIGAGDLGQRVPVKGGGELEQLAGDLNVMGGKLKEYHDHMERDVETLNERVAERTASLQKAFNELQERDKELKETHAALVQTEKLAAMGRLVAGVVHEVNNPLAYITGNIHVLKKDLTHLAELVRLYGGAFAAEDAPERERLLRDAREKAETVDIEYTLGGLDDILSRTSEGIENIRRIVADLRDFSRMGEAEREPVDLNESINTTLGMITYDLRKKQISVETDLAELPLVACTPVKMNQVLLNILLNAVQAVSENGHIWVTTEIEDDWMSVMIRDDGHGIPEEIIGRIFDPFFTTRPPGEGTGLGLSVSYGIMQEHGGTIDVTSTPGEGAEFTVRLPVRRDTCAATVCSCESKDDELSE
ncbi:MAG: HAMP domain-containing protein [Planctomycetes bacterium]|nr:HAMP domain-containing protein [Planctomycetota bacterium]